MRSPHAGVQSAEDDTEELLWCSAASNAQASGCEKRTWWAWSWGFGGWGYSVGLMEMLQVAQVLSHWLFCNRMEGSRFYTIFRANSQKQ